MARVGGAAVTQAELGHWTSIYAANEPAGRKRMLGFLIRARWLADEAQELAVALPPGEVKRQLAELAADEAEKVIYRPLPDDAVLRQLLLASRGQASDRRWLMELTLLRARVERVRLQRARREVPRVRVERFYARHKRSFFLPDQRQLEIIGGGKPQILQAKREVESGRPFLDVAKVSLDPEAPGGLWRLIRGHDEPQVEGPVFAAKPHVLVGPKHYSQYYIFEVLEVLPAHQQTLAEVEGAIRRALAPTRAQLARAAERRWVARTTCVAADVLPECRQYQGGVGRARARRGATR